MTWFVIGTVLLVLAGVAVVAAGTGGTLAPDEERPATVLPGGDLAPDDLRGVRFTTSLSGYHPQEVDALLERVAAQWEAQGESQREAAAPAERPAAEAPASEAPASEDSDPLQEPPARD